METVQLGVHLNKRLDYLRSLGAGWFDHNRGVEISRTVIEATETLLRYSTGILPDPYLFPSEDGSVSVEWQTLENPLTIDVYEDYYEFALLIKGSVERHEFSFLEIERLVEMMSLTGKKG